MNDQTNHNEYPFMEAMAGKVEKQDAKIARLEEGLKKLPDHSEEIGQVKELLMEVNATVKNIFFPTREMRELSRNMADTNGLLKQPLEQKIVHHHYIDKAVWVAAILFNGVVALIVLLFNARNRIGENQESDIKYRYMELSKDEKLRTILKHTDSLYFANPEQFRKDVIREEDWRKEQLELLRQSLEKEQESKRLKEKARGK